MSLDILKKELNNKTVRNLYLFYGPEEYLKKYYLESIEKMILQDDLRTLNRYVIEGKTDIGKLIDICETMPVFSNMRIVIVKNSGFFKPGKKSEDSSKSKGAKSDAKNDAKSDAKSDTKSSGFTSYMEDIPEHTCLIFYEDEIDRRLKAVDAIKKKGLVVEFSYQKPEELTDWVVRKLKSGNKRISPGVASYLVENCEPDMNHLMGELNKLALYTGDNTDINRSDIDEVCIKSIKGRIFDLTDAIAEKNYGRAVKLLDDMIILKEPIPKILFMVARQFRHILEMKSLDGTGLNIAEKASRIGITPYAAGKIAKQAGNFSADQLKQAIEQCLEFDIAVKTGKINDRIALELLITGSADFT